MAPKKWYAVANGHQPGIYESWAEAKVQILGHSNNCHQSFRKREDAEAFMDTYRKTTIALSSTSSGDRLLEERREADDHEGDLATTASSPPSPLPSSSSSVLSVRLNPTANEPVISEANSAVVQIGADHNPTTPVGNGKKGHWRKRNSTRGNKGSAGNSVDGLTQSMDRVAIRVNVSRV